MDKAKSDRDYVICKANKALDDCLSKAAKDEGDCDAACAKWSPSLRVGCIYACDAWFSSFKTGCYAAAASVISGAWIVYGTAQAACQSGATINVPVDSSCPVGFADLGIGY